MIRFCVHSILMMLCVASLSACDTIIEVDNLPARITSIGPLDARNRVEVEGLVSWSQVRVNYTLRDYEGDDAKLNVEVCDADRIGGTYEPDDACGVAVEGLLSDGTERVPTAPFDTDVPHQFRWDVGCGRIIGDGRTLPDYTLNYVFRFRVKGATDDPVISDPFHLVDDLGFDPQAELECNP